jgi:LmbE family N-acetylglucosaminyl deacetylase
MGKNSWSQKEIAMPYDALVIAAHPDDAEVQMGGTVAKMTDQGVRVLFIDLCTGEPADYAEPGVRARQAIRAAAILGADRIMLEQQDRFIQDTIPLRLQLAELIRSHRPRWVFGTAEACVHPDHAAMEPLVTAAVFYARLQNWERVAGGEVLAATTPWAVDRLFFPHCKMEPAWGRDFAFAVDGARPMRAKSRRWRSIARSSASMQVISFLNYMKQKICTLGGSLVLPTLKYSKPTALC